MKIAGIDPGLGHTGVALVEGTRRGVTAYSFGTVVTEAGEPLPSRLHLIYAQLKEMLEARRPDLIVVEDVFSLTKYPKSGILLGKVTGAILIAGCDARVPVWEVAVREAKKVLTGNGSASKAQLERSVRRHLRRTTPITPSHASDALALALIGLFRSAGPEGSPKSMGW